MTTVDHTSVPPDDELGRLVNALCDGFLQIDARDRLVALLEHDREAKLFCAEFLDLHALMLWRHREVHFSGPPANAPGMAPISTRGTTLQQREPPSPFSQLPVLGLLARNAAALNRPIVWSILAVAVVFYGTFAMFSWNLRPDKPLSGTDGRDSTVATIGNSASVQWSTRTTRYVHESIVRPGESLSIDSGVLELNLSRGAKLFVEGPAQWTIDGENAARLQFGKLVARVSPNAVGFMLNTPTAKIVDLGTEFGVDVAKHGETAVQVYEGAVEFSPKRSKKSATTSGRPAVRRLRAGEAAQTDAVTQNVVAAEFLPDKFVRRTHDTAKPTRGEVFVDLTTVTATQSSDFASYVAQAAIDGDLKICSHTDSNDSAPWWQVDLGRERAIAVVLLHNRNQVAGTLRDITVKILADDGETVVAISPKLNPKNSLGGGELEFDAGPAQLAFDLVRTRREPAIGRFVRIEREPCTIETNRMKSIHNTEEWGRSMANALVLGEVQVFESAVQTASPPSEKANP